jgi:cell division protease FtsH
VEGRREEREAEPRMGRGLRWGRRIWLIVLAVLILNWVMAALLSGDPDRHSVSYTLFRQQVQAGNVDEVTSEGDTIQGVFSEPLDVEEALGEDDAAEEGTFTRFETHRPAFADDDLLRLMIQNDVVVNARPLEEGRPIWQLVLLYFGPALLFLFILLFVFSRIAQRASGGGMLSGMGRSKARRYEPSLQRTTFKDVAGIDEAKEELGEIVGFLQDPERYRRLGARIPKGVLLMGSPGTGKTLLARAVAGEAGVPFFWLSASEFVEMIVGVGASRVRDLFTQAKEAAPAIIFIDELDAIGRSRQGGPSLGGSDEREQTLNQILTEMDGFSGSEGVIVLAATNRAEVLDAALLRPGRFDRRLTINPPDQKGREKILKVHVRKVRLSPKVDLSRLASTTPGMVGADLANLVNEAALLAARRGHHVVEPSDFSDAMERIILGSERKIVLSREQRERTAYHESGHALLGMLQPGADPVRKVSIVPRGESLGVTYQSPQADRYGYDSGYLKGRIIGALGGRAAEHLKYADTTTGAESDLEQVTAIARRMVGRWGMSEAVGPVSLLPREEQQSLMGDGRGPSDESRRLMDIEVRRIIEDCYEKAVELLRENRDKLDRLAATLLEHETLDQDEVYKVVGVSPRAASQKEAPPGGEAESALDPLGERPAA